MLEAILQCLGCRSTACSFVDVDAKTTVAETETEIFSRLGSSPEACLSLSMAAQIDSQGVLLVTLRLCVPRHCVSMFNVSSSIAAWRGATRSSATTSKAACRQTMNGQSRHVTNSVREGTVPGQPPPPPLFGRSSCVRQLLGGCVNKRWIQTEEGSSAQSCVFARLVVWYVRHTQDSWCLWFAVFV